MKRIVSGLLAAGLLCLAVAAQAQMNLLTGAGGKFRATSSSVPFGLSFVTSADQGSPGGSSCNFGTVNTGTTDPTRKTVLVVLARFTTAATLSSVTVGGNAQTVVINTNSASAAASAITSTLNTSNTSDNITANYSATVVRCRVCVYRLVGTTAAVSSEGGDTGAGGNPSKTFTGTTGGGMVAGAVAGTNPDTTTTAANMTQDVNTLVAGAATTLGECASNTSNAGASTAYSWQYKAASINTGVTFNAASWVSIAP